MECILGIKFNDFVIVAADTSNIAFVTVVKKDQDKMYKLNDKLLMLACGEDGDTVQFAEYISKNIQLYKMRNGYELSPRAAAHFTRKNLAEYLRSKSPYHTNLLLAGFDDQDGPELYFIDYLASMVKIPYAAHGISSFFTLSVLDRYYKPHMSQNDAQKLVKLCAEELQRRFIMNLSAFRIRIIEKDGIKDMEPIILSKHNPLQVRS